MKMRTIGLLCWRTRSAEIQQPLHLKSRDYMMRDDDFLIWTGRKVFWSLLKYRKPSISCNVGTLAA